jgi:HlyD family secretion protein
MKHRGIIIVAAVCGLLISPVSCRPDTGAAETDFYGQTVVVSRGNLIVSVSGNGTIAVSKEIDISFDKAGKVSKIYIAEGDTVITGQILALLVPLDEGQLELDVARAEAALAQAEYNLDKAENPYTDKEIEDAEQEVEDAEDRLDLADDMLRYVLQHGGEWEVLQWQMEVLNAEIQLEMAEDKLDDMLNERDEDQIYVLKKEVAAAETALEEASDALATQTLVAPFTGIVTTVYIDEGKILPPPSVSQIPIIRLSDPTSMEFVISLDEIDIPGIIVGDRAVITVDAFPGTDIEGKVISITPLPVVEAGLVSYDVKIAFNVPQNMDIRIGMSATADIVKDDRQNVLLVPNGAISIDSEGNPVVMVVVSTTDGLKTEERPIAIGISDGLQTEVLSGLQEGDTIIARTVDVSN